jgi:transposase
MAWQAISAAGRPGAGRRCADVHASDGPAEDQSRRSGQATHRPDRVRGDKAYSSRAIRTHLRDRGITAVIPQPSDQIGHRKRRGSTGGRPPAFDREDYKGRNVVERNFNIFKQWRALATRYDKLALTYRGGAVLRAISI